MVAPAAAQAPDASDPPGPAVDEEYLETRLDGDYILNETRDDAADLGARRAEATEAAELLAIDDARLEAAIAALDDRIAAVEGEIAESYRAQEAAIRQEADVRAELAEAEAELAARRQAATDRAVEAYVRPARAVAIPVIQSDDFTELNRKTVLLRAVAEHDQWLLEELALAEDALDARRIEADEAAEIAEARRRESAALKDELDGARAEQAALKAELESRIAAFRAEADALAAEQAALDRLIANREARFQAEAELRAAHRIECAAGNTPIDEAGSPVECASLNEPLPPSSVMWPTPGRVSSEYGQRWGRLHAGVDIATDMGTPIVAAEDGTVFFAGWLGGYGNLTLIDHGAGVTTAYGHQSGFAVVEDQVVGRGEVIGFVGSTGRSTGPHLHFEIRLDGNQIDPREFLGR